MQAKLAPEQAPHPATVAQRRAAPFGLPRGSPPHPATKAVTPRAGWGELAVQRAEARADDKDRKAEARADDKDRKADLTPVKAGGGLVGHGFLKKLFPMVRNTKDETMYLREIYFTDPADYGKYLYRTFPEAQFAQFLGASKFPETTKYTGVSGNPRYASAIVGSKVKDQDYIYRYLVEFCVEDANVLKTIKGELTNPKVPKFEGEKGGKVKLEKWEKENYPEGLSNASLGLGETGAGSIGIKQFNTWLDEGKIVWRVVKMQLTR